jgi:hypothetical protein
MSNKLKANIIAAIMIVLIILGITVKPIGIIVGLIGGIVVMGALMYVLYYSLRELLLMVLNKLDKKDI